MEQEETLEWEKRQDVVKVRTIKDKEEDKFILTVGEYVVAPTNFDSQEEAEQYLEENFKLKNLELSIIGAMCQKLNNLSKNQQKCK